MVQVIWLIPEELMKRVSQAQFITTLRLADDIVNSAVAYAHDIQEALRAGAQAYLVKPVGFDELTRAAARLTVYAGKSNHDARTAELAAIREELATRRTENAERVERTREKRRRSEEKVIRLKAEMAFLAAGGSRGDFARLWPSVFKEEVRGHRGV